MADATPSVLFVGESPPVGAPLGFRPFDCASGTRLARHVIGLVDRTALLDHVPLANLFDRPTGVRDAPPWQALAAETSADAVLERPCRASALVPAALVLLGARVAAAFRLGPLPGPVSVAVGRDALGVRRVLVRAPHPSGTSTALNAPEVVREVRRALLPELVLGCPTLRPWHFRLDDPAVLEDLALAVAPLRPAAGVVVLEHAASAKSLRDASPPGSLLARVRDLRDEVDTVLPGAPSPPWDEPLRAVARDLLHPGGDVALSARWDPNGARGHGRKSWLPRLVAAMDDGRRRGLDALASSAVARATVLRYALGGLA